MCTCNKENLTRKSAVGHYASIGSRECETIEIYLVETFRASLKHLYLGRLLVLTWHFIGHTAVTPQNYCQISRTREQIKLVEENLSRKTCSSYIRVSELVRKLVKENLLVCTGLKSLYHSLCSGPARMQPKQNI